VRLHVRSSPSKGPVGRTRLLEISNVRGLVGTLYLGGRRIREFYYLAEIAPHHALRVSAGSFGRRMSIRLSADANAVPDLPVPARGIGRSPRELTAGVAEGRP